MNDNNPEQLVFIFSFKHKKKKKKKTPINLLLARKPALPPLLYYVNAQEAFVSSF